jgi:anti-sigma B factor antagonist
MRGTLEGPSAVTGLSVSIDAAARVVRVVGELDVATRVALRDAGEQLAAAACADIVVDLAGVCFIDAAGLGALVELRNTQSGNGRQLRVESAPPAIARVFDLVGLGALLSRRLESPGSWPLPCRLLTVCSTISTSSTCSPS